MQLLLKTFEREESVMATNNTTHEQENDLRPEKGIFWPAMIGVLLIALPIALLYIFLQKYLISGLTAGGTKG